VQAMNTQEFVRMLRQMSEKLEDAADCISCRKLGTYEVQEYVRNFILRDMNKIVDATLSTKGQ